MSSLENPTYALIKGTSDHSDVDEPRYQTLTGQLESSNTYEDPTQLREACYEVVNDDLSKEVPVYDDIMMKNIPLNEYQSLDEI